MIHRGPDFLDVVWFVSLSSCGAPIELTGGKGGGGGAKSYDSEKARSFIINHPILSGMGSQRDVVYLGWPIAPSYMSPNEGGGGLQVSTNEYSCAHRAQIKRLEIELLIYLCSLVIVIHVFGEQSITSALITINQDAVLLLLSKYCIYISLCTCSFTAGI